MTKLEEYEALNDSLIDECTDFLSGLEIEWDTADNDEDGSELPQDLPAGALEQPEGNGNGMGNEGDDEDTDEKEGNGKSGTGGEDEDDDTNGRSMGQMKAPEETEETEETTGGSGDDEVEDEGTDPTTELTEKEIKAMIKALEAQQTFLDGTLKKTDLSKGDQKALAGARDADASVESVTVENRWGGGTSEEKVVVIRKISKKTLGICGMVGKYTSTTSTQAVIDGMRLGTMLGKKLQIRNDDVTTQVNRQNKGRIDKRLLAEFGVGNTRLFESSYTVKTNDCGIHISIDASGSMGGTRWANAIKTAVAIAKACDMVGGIRVRIDVRSIDNCKLHTRGSGAVVAVVYDSKVNKLQHIKQLFPYVQVSGGTPEGLCFEAIMDIIKQGGNDTDRYFINMSDGAPSSNYVQLTTDSVKKMKRSGMKVLSYFIGNSTERNRTFDTMYGDSAAYVDSNNVMEIAKTLNKLLAQRG